MAVLFEQQRADAGSMRLAVRAWHLAAAGLGGERQLHGAKILIGMVQPGETWLRASRLRPASRSDRWGRCAAQWWHAVAAQFVVGKTVATKHACFNALA